MRSSACTISGYLSVVANEVHQFFSAGFECGPAATRPATVAHNNLRCGVDRQKLRGCGQLRRRPRACWSVRSSNSDLRFVTDCLAISSRAAKFRFVSEMVLDIRHLEIGEAFLRLLQFRLIFGDLCLDELARALHIGALIANVLLFKDRKQRPGRQPVWPLTPNYR